jgi:hypothetical protein
MSKRIVLTLCFSIAGCSTEAPTVRVDSTAAARIGAPDRQRFTDTYEREIVAAKAELQRAQAELAPDQAELDRANAAVHKGTSDVPLRHVLDLKTHWASARLHWRKTEIDCEPAHEWAVVAAEELDKAQIVVRFGADLDVDQFKSQHRRMDEAWGDCMGKVAAAHTAADTAERELADAKNHYAHERLIAALPSPSPLPTH